MFFVAKRSIGESEEITNNYGVHHLNLVRAKRLQMLEQGYKFKCNCAACQNDYPLLNKLGM